MIPYCWRSCRFHFFQEFPGGHEGVMISCIGFVIKVRHSGIAVIDLFHINSTREGPFPSFTSFLIDKSRLKSARRKFVFQILIQDEYI